MLRRIPISSSVSTRRLPTTTMGVSRSAAWTGSSSPSSSSARIGSPTLRVQQRRTFLNFFNRSQVDRVVVDEATFDKQYSHWAGKLFGIPMDTVIYYLKINGGVMFVVATIYMFFQGYMHLSQFSLATIGRLGFTAGFISCGVLYSMALTMRRMYSISPNAVYNQAISIAMKNGDVLQHLGTSPRTGDFKAYCASGGFKLPLLRRLRSGQYELADLFGTKPRRLQMMFVLRAQNGNEGLVSCEVKKAQSAKLFASNYYFQSLTVHLTGPEKKEASNAVIIGRESDAIYKGIFKF